jgi:hypothetical protein
MSLKIIELPEQFRPSTSITYPPFKNGRYMEEYVYEYLMENKDDIKTDLVYLPVFWTNLQNHRGFSNSRDRYEIILHNILYKYIVERLPVQTKFFTIVQHDDGPQLTIPPNTIIFGACTGSIPLPLIYEDVTNRLNTIGMRNPKEPMRYLASFIGSDTHPIRRELCDVLQNDPDIHYIIKNDWTNSIPEEDCIKYIDASVHSKFSLAPRGYGRSSFRFFEAIQMNIIPVYFWDDKLWLPYQDEIDYSKFSLSINKVFIGSTLQNLKVISDEKYKMMLDELKKVKHMFTMEYMCTYIIKRIEGDR